MKILITGSTGLVGSEAVSFFTEKGWEVVEIDNDMRHKFFGTPSKRLTGLEQTTHRYWLDIRDNKDVEIVFRKSKFDAIIHAAAQPSHDYSKEHPREDFEINAVGTMNLLEATRKYCPEATFVYVSTDKVYGTNMKRDLTEKETRWHSPFPFTEYEWIDEATRSPFGCSKLAADLYVQEYGYQYGMKTACFRCSCITGRNHEGAEQHGFLAYLTKCIKEGKPYTIYGYKGKQVRDQIHAYDLVNAFWYFIQKPQIAQVYNMGGGPERSVSILEAITLIENEYHRLKPIEVSKGKVGNWRPEMRFTAKTEYVFEERFGDRQWDVIDVSRFREDYPEWDYKYSLADIIKDVCQK